LTFKRHKGAGKSGRKKQLKLEEVMGYLWKSLGRAGKTHMIR
jgi:hypothetical protein